MYSKCQKIRCYALICVVFKNNLRLENYPPRHRTEKPAEKGEELSILKIWVGERIRIFGQNIDPWWGSRPRRTLGGAKFFPIISSPPLKRYLNDSLICTINRRKYGSFVLLYPVEFLLKKRCCVDKISLFHLPSLHFG